MSTDGVGFRAGKGGADDWHPLIFSPGDSEVGVRAVLEAFGIGLADAGGECREFERGRLAVDATVCAGVADEVYAAVGEVASAAQVDVCGVLRWAHLADTPVAVVAHSERPGALDVADACDPADAFHDSERI